MAGDKVADFIKKIKEISKIHREKKLLDLEIEEKELDIMIKKQKINKDLERKKISPDAIDASDPTMTEQLVKAACSDAYAKMKQKINEEFSPGLMGMR